MPLNERTPLDSIVPPNAPPATTTRVVAGRCGASGAALWACPAAVRTPKIRAVIRVCLRMARLRGRQFRGVNSAMPIGKAGLPWMPEPGFRNLNGVSGPATANHGAPLHRNSDRFGDPSCHCSQPLLRLRYGIRAEHVWVPEATASKAMSCMPLRSERGSRSSPPFASRRTRRPE